MHNPGPQRPCQNDPSQKYVGYSVLQPVSNILFQRIVDLDDRGQDGNQNHESNDNDAQEGQSVFYKILKSVLETGDPIVPVESWWKVLHPS